MKKLIAVLVAIMILAMPVAFAQEVFYLADPVLSMGEMGTYDLTGLELCFAGGTVGETVAAKIFANSADGTLFAIDVNAVGETLLLTATGLSSVYSVKVPADALSKIDTSNFKLPDEVVEEITGIVMQSIEIDAENGTIRIPYTAVNDILEKIAPYLEQLDIPGLKIEEVVDNVAQLKEKNSGLDLVGTVAAIDEGNASVDFSVYMVDNGAIAETPAFNFSFSMGEDGFSMILDAGDQGSLAVAYADGEASLSFTQGEIEYVLSAKVGTRDAEVEFVDLDGSNAIDIESLGEEDMSKISEELMTGASGLIGFLMTALTGAAA